MAADTSAAAETAAEAEQARVPIAREPALEQLSKNAQKKLLKRQRQAKLICFAARKAGQALADHNHSLMQI